MYTAPVLLEASWPHHVGLHQAAAAAMFIRQISLMQV